jgi:MFS family permease
LKIVTTSLIRFRDPIKILAAGWAIRWFGISFYTPFILIYLNIDLGIPYVLAGLYLAIPNILALMFPVIGGGLTDRFGRRRIMIISLVLEAAGIGVLAGGVYLSAVSAVLGGLLVARASATAGQPSISAYVTDVTSPNRRAAGFAWLRSALNVGYTGGVAAGGALLAILSFGEIAVGATLVTAFGAILIAILLPLSSYDQSLATSRTSSGGRAITLQNDEGHSAAKLLHTPLVALVRDRSLLLVWASACAMWTLNLQIGYAVPAFAHSTLRVPYAILGIALALNSAIVAGGQVPFTRAFSGRSMTRTGSIGVLAYAAGFLGLGITGILMNHVIPLLLLLVIVITLGESMVFFPVSALPMNIAPEDARGAYAGAMAMTSGFGNIMAPIFAGFALGVSTNSLVEWGIMTLPAIPAILLLWSLGLRVPKELNTA